MAICQGQYSTYCVCYDTNTDNTDFLSELIILLLLPAMCQSLMEKIACVTTASELS